MTQTRRTEPVGRSLNASSVASSIYEIPGVDNEKGKLLERLCGGARVMDLLLYAPINFIDRRNTVLSKSSIGKVVTFSAVVNRHIPSPRKTRKVPYRVLLDTEIGGVYLVFFHYSRGYLESVLKVGSQCVVSGKLEINCGEMQVVHPGRITGLEKFSQICTLEPVYAVCKGLHSGTVRRFIESTLKLLPDLQEWIESDLMRQNSWYRWKQSIEKMHHPSASGEELRCKARLAYDELLSHHLAMLRVKQRRRNSGVSVKSNGLYHKLVLERLGFKLTAGQISAISRITNDQASPKQMARLLQGDVGSGKTVVALFAMLNVVEGAGQVALMVPTELLAEQHCLWIKSALVGLDICVELLTGKTKKKALLRDRLLAGEIKIIVGTHALFQEAVTFHNLRLVVIDEQQRFGVLQRMKLIEKGKSADILFITATPIPRTLEQILYGSMDRITLPDKPSCRLPIHTSIVALSKIDEVCSRLETALTQGHKAYWICPHIEDSELSDTAAAEGRFLFLQERFGDAVGISHGALPRASRDESIRDFHSGKIKLLVATTVIEVGIDVHDATIIVIENPERFGLSQLHQLRGRVGRGNKQSFCILLHGPIGKNSYRKLSVLRSSQDGFFIAEQDLALRGGGDMLGCRQSGTVDFRFADPFDVASISSAYYDACRMVKTEEGRLSAVRLMKIFGYSLPDVNY